MTHSVNVATIKALGTLVSSTLPALWCPGPWFPEIADYAKSHPEIDFGLHLTLTSERVYYRWGPVAFKRPGPGLATRTATFITIGRDTHIDPKDAELELRRQIDRAYAMGIHPSHLDSHQYRLIDNGRNFRAFLRVAHAYRLPVFVTRDWFAEHPYLESSLARDDIVLDHPSTSIRPSLRNSGLSSIRRPLKIFTGYYRIRDSPSIR